MTPGEALKGLRARCDGWFHAAGYGFDRARSAYARRSALGSDFVYLRVLSVGGSARLELSAALRVDAVAGALARATKVEPRTAAMMNTLWTPAERFEAWPLAKSRMELPTPAALDDAARAVMQFAEEVALPFLASVGTLSEVDLILNSDPGAPSVHCAQPHRALQGVIVAKLLGRADLARLVEAHRRALASVDRGFHLADLEAVLSDPA